MFFHFFIFWWEVWREAARCCHLGREPFTKDDREHFKKNEFTKHLEQGRAPSSRQRWRRQKQQLEQRRQDPTTRPRRRTVASGDRGLGAGRARPRTAQARESSGGSTRRASRGAHWPRGTQRSAAEAAAKRERSNVRVDTTQLWRDGARARGNNAEKLRRSWPGSLRVRVRDVRSQLVFGLLSERTRREMATWRIQAQTVATTTQASLPQRASSTQCRRADPRATRWGGVSGKAAGVPRAARGVEKKTRGPARGRKTRSREATPESG